MGHETDPDPPGNDCEGCWAAGKTPSIIYVSFTGISDCQVDPGIIPPPTNDIVSLNQTQDHPCEWDRLFDDGKYFWHSPVWFGNTVMEQYFQGTLYFTGWEVGHCQTQFSNTATCVIGNLGENGEAAVTWNTGPIDHAIGSLLNAINMEPHANTKFEFWPASEERICVRFARKSDATNILILVEPTEL